MKVTKLFFAIAMSASLVFSGCSSMSSTAKGTLIGAGAGTAVGAGAGVGIAALAGKNKKKGAIIGAAAGAAVGAGTGALIGRKMDKKKKELEALKAAQVETTTDNNGLEAIKVTFGENGIKFSTNSATLNADAKAALKEFATTMADMTDTNIQVYGHTDNTGSLEANQKVSTNRAKSVADYLQSCGINASRISSAGLDYSDPVADNSTAAGRAQNRRVEIFISADAAMIEAANNGTLE
ncbi:MAG: OmpA family protein [Bacteroidales bacterium]|nr:OmpA family protein [Bacteroidales bacterium]